MDKIFGYIDQNLNRFIEELFVLLRQPSISARWEGRRGMFPAFGGNDGKGRDQTSHPSHGRETEPSFDLRGGPKSGGHDAPC